MHRARWKSKYLTGDPLADQLHRDLVQLVGTLVTELERREHCQELNELVVELTARVRVRLELGGRMADPRGGDWSALRELLAVGFPLATRSSPACRDCGLCDGVKDQVAAWLDKAPDAVGQREASAKPGAERG